MKRNSPFLFRLRISATPAATTSLATPDPNASSEGKPPLPSDYIYRPDGKQLEPLQLSDAQIIVANVKILESLFIKSPLEAAGYLTYLKFFGNQRDTLQTMAVLAFDQDYRATKATDKYSWGSNLDDLSSQYFDAAVAQRPSRTNDSRGENRESTSEEFCFRWNFNANGCPSPQSCRYRHVCIHCSSTWHKGRSCSGAASTAESKT